MFNDDIDWTDASCDFGLVILCREMASLANPMRLPARREPQRSIASARRSRAPMSTSPRGVEAA